MSTGGSRNSKHSEKRGICQGLRLLEEVELNLQTVMLGTNCTGGENMMSVERRVQKSEYLKEDGEKLSTWSRKFSFEVLKIKAGT